MAKVSLYYRLKERLLTLPFRFHIIVSILIRVIFIIYGTIHDQHSDVPFTDIDYIVVTDGARQLLAGNSPFNRHTYRYSPLYAFMQIPNVVLYREMGKFIYSCFDILVALLIYSIVRNELQSQCNKAVQYLLAKYGKATKFSASVNYGDSDTRKSPERIAKASACFWLYNPLTAVISTRGNGDSFSSFFVIFTLYLLIKSDDCRENLKKRNWLIFIAGCIHGFAIHLRLYPLLFSLAYYLTLSRGLVRSIKDFLRILLFPSFQQLLLVFGTLLSLTTFTCIFYKLYGWQYIYEGYLYHFIRKDIRHNFSLYFLMQYLSSGLGVGGQGMLEKIVILAPQFILILYLTIGFGQYRQTLPFCIFSVTYTLVTFNSVVTSQYFIWYMALLPLCINNFSQTMSMEKSAFYFGLWMLSQGLWLLPAYLLEFQMWNTFYWIGAQSVLFFVVNNLILARLIENYSFTSFKIRKLF
ncbi:GPI mannosyltransferase 1 [Stomoxys calcitrans]|uniref:GPI alpha-1,4-mannosyltransferase I, catalytic subunit n=1 Tax=Stomoxys calcitrans TaxID=35570 RepID=A0A1I8Q911_STOCA|nr:GPI mannosyltransferase 1 [Stomoxys calcitrans]